MKNIGIRCPCCDNNLILQIDDTGNISSAFFHGEELSNSEAFEQYGICLGEVGDKNFTK